MPGEEAGLKPGDPEASRKTPQDLSDWYYALAAEQVRVRVRVRARVRVRVRVRVRLRVRVWVRARARVRVRVRVLRHCGKAG